MGSAFSGATQPRGFNPCSNGLSAQSPLQRDGMSLETNVSILVLMDFRLKALPTDAIGFGLLRFNPCSNGLSAQRPRRAGVPGGVFVFQSLF